MQSIFQLDWTISCDGFVPAARAPTLQPQDDKSDCHASVSTWEAFHLKPTTRVLEASRDGLGKEKTSEDAFQLLSAYLDAAHFICGALILTVLCPILCAEWWWLTLAGALAEERWAKTTVFPHICRCVNALMPDYTCRHIEEYTR